MDGWVPGLNLELPASGWIVPSEDCGCGVSQQGRYRLDWAVSAMMHILLVF
jgi:hypothetical protein